jgi:hypothetical protein
MPLESNFDVEDELIDFFRNKQKISRQNSGYMFFVFTKYALESHGIVNPEMEIYVSGILNNFISVERVYKICEEDNRRHFYIFDMIQRARKEPEKQYLIHKHIGDFSLFTSGVFPKSVERQKCIDKNFYIHFGKSSYSLASSIGKDNSEVLGNISKNFEICVEALNDTVSQYVSPRSSSLIKKAL